MSSCTFLYKTCQTYTIRNMVKRNFIHFVTIRTSTKNISVDGRIQLKLKQVLRTITSCGHLFGRFTELFTS